MVSSKPNSYEDIERNHKSKTNLTPSEKEENNKIQNNSNHKTHEEP